MRIGSVKLPLCGAICHMWQWYMLRAESVITMQLGKRAHNVIWRNPIRFFTMVMAAMSLSLADQAATAQEAPAEEAVAEASADAPAADAAPAEGAATEAASAYTPLGPDMIVGQPVAAEDDFYGSMQFQPQYSPTGEQALWMHDKMLLPVITIISLFVLGLLLFVVARFRKSANPVPSKTSHNALIEVVWTAVPALILLVIAVPSIQLLLEQYKSPPKDALTVKVNGYQWYWGYEYPDYGMGEVISNMMPEDEAKEKGLPPQLAVDNRMVVPVGEEIRIQTFGKDVIHAFAVPSLWFKLDAVPGRINEGKIFIKEPGIYYGQCSELCGARHGYMPIAVEAVSREQFEAWVVSRGGTLPSDAPAEEVPAEEGADAPAEEAEVALAN